MRRVGHGRDEGGDDLEVLVAELVHDGVGAVAERAEEGETGSPALVGVAEVDCTRRRTGSWTCAARILSYVL